MVDPTPYPPDAEAKSMAIDSETVVPELTVSPVAYPEPIEEEIEETCCSWDYDLTSDGNECWD